jgi:hypothetical protein
MDPDNEVGPACVNTRPRGTERVNSRCAAQASYAATWTRTQGAPIEGSTMYTDDFRDLIDDAIDALERAFRDEGGR